MPPYRKYTTTVVGAHSVPRWYEALDRLVTLGPSHRRAILPTRSFVPLRPRFWNRRPRGSTSSRVVRCIGGPTIDTRRQMPC